MNDFALVWIAGALIAGFLGSFSTIGFWKAFLLALFLSFPVGAIIAFRSQRKGAVKNTDQPATLGEELLMSDESEESIPVFATHEINK